MTCDEVLSRLRRVREVFEERLAVVPEEALDIRPPGHAHSVKEVVSHLTAYDELVVERLREARLDNTTAFDRDRIGWEVFNERTWREAERRDVTDVLDRSRETYDALISEVARLTDGDLAGRTSLARALDPAWLDGRAPWELIGIDVFDHYPMHFSVLEAAARARVEASASEAVESGSVATEES